MIDKDNIEPKLMLEKASEHGAKICCILKIKEHYGENVVYTITDVVKGQGVKLDLPFMYEGKFLNVVDKQLEFFNF